LTAEIAHEVSEHFRIGSARAMRGSDKRKEFSITQVMTG